MDLSLTGPLRQREGKRKPLRDRERKLLREHERKPLRERERKLLREFCLSVSFA